MQILVVVLLLSFLAACSLDEEKGVKDVAEMTYPEIAALWDNNDLDRTVSHMNRAREMNNDLAYHLEIHTQLARVKGMKGDFEGAHAILDSVETTMKPDMDKVRIRYLLERGRVYNSSGEQEKSLPLFEEALKLSQEKKHDNLAVDAVHMLGIAGPPEKQIEWNLIGLDIVENSDNRKLQGWIGPICNNLGWSYHDNGEHEKALQYFQKGLDWRESVGDQQGARVARWTIARTLRSLERIDEALEMQLALEKEFRENNLPPDGFVAEELGELYLMKGNRDEASKWFSQAWKILSQDPWISKHEPERVQRLKKLGQGKK